MSGLRMKRTGPVLIGWWFLTWPLLMASIALGLCGWESGWIEDRLSYCFKRSEGE